jgi:hypothetical protein
MPVIDLGTRILQANQSLLPRDANTFNEVEVPTVDPATLVVRSSAPASSSSSTSGRAPALADTNDVLEDG